MGGGRHARGRRPKRPVDELRRVHAGALALAASDRNCFVLDGEGAPNSAGSGAWTADSSGALLEGRAGRSSVGRGGSVNSYGRSQKAWRVAPICAGSQLWRAFPCGHPRPDTLERSCLNGDCPGRGLAPRPRWVELCSSTTDPASRRLQLSRCSFCNFPHCFGRTVFRLEDLLATSLRRERGSQSREHAFAFSM